MQFFENIVVFEIFSFFPLKLFDVSTGTECLGDFTEEEDDLDI